MEPLLDVIIVEVWANEQAGMDIRCMDIRRCTFYYRTLLLVKMTLLLIKIALLLILLLMIYTTVK